MSSPVWLASISDPRTDRAEPLPVQLYKDIASAVLDGRIGCGEHLPSSRQAAKALGVSRTTVTAAYELLAAEGIAAIRQGAVPTIIAPQAAPCETDAAVGPSVSERGMALGAGHLDRVPRPSSGALAPGGPDEGLFPADEWARTLRRVARRPLGSAALYGAAHGVEALRRALRDRLATDRGVRVDTDQIVIVPGTQAAVALLAHALCDPGDVAALEDPGWPGARTACRGAGLTVVPLTVDRWGADPHTLPPDTRLTYLTPSNQYPLGTRLSQARRLAFLDRARSAGAFIVEDDYDSDFHWSGGVIPALAAQDHGGHVVLVGSASKTLLPALRIGWMVVPPGLVDPIRAAQRSLGIVANVHAQLALAELMQTGRYRTQVRRIARAYHERVRGLVDALADVSAATVTLPDGGVHVTVRLAGEKVEATAVERLARHGLTPGQLSDYCAGADHHGLVVGLGDATATNVMTLRDVLLSLPDRTPDEAVDPMLAAKR